MYGFDSTFKTNTNVAAQAAALSGRGRKPRRASLLAGTALAGTLLAMSMAPTRALAGCPGTNPYTGAHGAITVAAGGVGSCEVSYTGVTQTGGGLLFDGPNSLTFDSYAPASSITNALGDGIDMFTWGLAGSSDIVINNGITTGTVGTDIKAAGFGIHAWSATGSITINNSGTIDTVTYSGYQGIRATSGGAAGTVVTIDNAGDITANWTAIRAIQYGGGAISITNSADLASKYGDGIHASTSAISGGAVSVINSGSIGYDGGIVPVDAHGIYVETSATPTSSTDIVDGYISITNTGSIYSLESGIKAAAYGGGNIDIENGGPAAGDGGLIYAGYAADGVTVVNPLASGIHAYSFGGGAITVDNNVSGQIYATNDGIKVWQDSVLPTTPASTGSITVTNEGNIGSTAQPVGYNGIFAGMAGDNYMNAISVTNSGNIYASNEGAVAYSFVGGDVTVANSATGTISSVFGGIDAQAGLGIDGYSGTVTVTNAGTVQATGALVGIVLTPGDGILASNFGTSRDPAVLDVLGQTNPLDVSVTNSGTVVGGGTLVSGVYTTSGFGGDGINVIDFGTGDTVVSNEAGGAVYGDAGIHVAAVGGGNAIVLNSGLVVSVGGDAIDAWTSGLAGGAVYVENYAGAQIYATGDGIHAWNSGDYLSVTGGVQNYTNTTFFSPTTAIAIDTEVVNAGGIGTPILPVGGDGIKAGSAGTGAVIVENNSGGAIYADGDGINAKSINGGAVGVYNDGGVFSTNGDGIHATADGLFGAFSLTPAGSVDVFNDVGGIIEAPNGTGIYARTHEGFGLTLLGNVTVLNLGKIEDVQQGIYARASATGGGNVIVGNGGYSTTIPITTPTTTTGLYGQAVNSNALISSVGNGITADIGTSFAAQNIDIQNWGVTNSTSTGGIFSTDGSAISVRNFSAGATSIYNAGTLVGDGATLATAVISIDPYGKGLAAPTIITNAATGSISSDSGSWSDLAIAAGSRSDGAVTIINAGTIVGRVSLTNGDDSFTNTGIWKTSGTNYFYAGNDLIWNKAGGLIVTQGQTTFNLGSGTNTVINAGTIEVKDGGPSLVTGDATFTGGNLTFDNAGLIDMSHDGLNLTTNTVNILGNFNATGSSTLAVNAFLGGPGSTSDHLFVSGNVTGTTSIKVVDANSAGPGAYNPVGISVVSVGGTGTSVSGSSPNFVLNPMSSDYGTISGTGVLNKGLFFYFLGQDPNGTATGATGGGVNGVALYSLPGQTAQELPIALTGAQNLWQETALMWEDRQSEIRDWMYRPTFVPTPGLVTKGPLEPAPVVEGPGAGIWAKAIGSWTTRSDTTSEKLAGQTFNFDLGYKQDSYGVIGGADFGKAGVFRPGDALIFGAMGGYVESHLNFNNGGDSFVYTGGTIGGSASYISNGVFIDGLVKADLLRLSLNTPSLLGSSSSMPWGPSVDMNTVGGIGNIGYRFQAGPYFLEPIGTMTYSQSHIDTVDAWQALGANVNFGNGESFRGAVGGRVGMEVPTIIPGHVVEAWIMGRVWDEFLGNNNTVDIVNGGPDAILIDNFQKVFGEVKGGFTVVTLASGWSGFANVGVKFNDQFTTVTAKGGVNYQW